MGSVGPVVLLVVLVDGKNVATAQQKALQTLAVKKARRPVNAGVHAAPAGDLQMND